MQNIFRGAAVRGQAIRLVQSGSLGRRLARDKVRKDFVDAFLWKVDAFIWKADAFIWKIYVFLWKVDAFLWKVDAFIWKVDAFLWKVDAFLWIVDAFLWKSWEILVSFVTPLQYLDTLRAVNSFHLLFSILPFFTHLTQSPASWIFYYQFSRDDLSCHQ